jgi:hypothetical protein
MATSSGSLRSTYSSLKGAALQYTADSKPSRQSKWTTITRCPQIFNSRKGVSCPIPREIHSLSCLRSLGHVERCVITQSELVAVDLLHRHNFLPAILILRETLARKAISSCGSDGRDLCEIWASDWAEVGKAGLGAIPCFDVSQHDSKTGQCSVNCLHFPVREMVDRNPIDRLERAATVDCLPEPCGQTPPFMDAR